MTSVGEADAWRRVSAMQSVTRRLHEIAERKAAEPPGHLTASPERRAERRAQKRACMRKKAERKSGRR